MDDSCLSFPLLGFLLIHFPCGYSLIWRIPVCLKVDLVFSDKASQVPPKPIKTEIAFLLKLPLMLLQYKQVAYGFI